MHRHDSWTGSPHTHARVYARYMYKHATSMRVYAAKMYEVWYIYISTNKYIDVPLKYIHAARNQPALEWVVLGKFRTPLQRAAFIGTPVRNFNRLTQSIQSSHQCVHVLNLVRYM